MPERSGACRDFLAELARLAETPAGAPAGEHVARCSACARHLAAARANVLLLRGLPTLTLPAGAPGLDAIHERAAAAAEQRLRDLLGRTITPVAAPEALTSGGLDEGASAMATGLPRALPRPRTPGWLRARVREDLRQLRERRLRARRWRVAALAAALLACVGLVGGLLRPRNVGPGGTEDGVQFVFVTLASAPHPELSPTGVVRLLGREVR
jgi:hypothetical protein